MPAATGQAFNRTREASLATRLAVADTHWTRFLGLMGQDIAKFSAGSGLWIVPCRGVHTLAMHFPIDVIYLDAGKLVVHLEEDLKPWRMAKISLKANSVLELPSQTIRRSGTRLGDRIEIVIDRAERNPTA
jgi:uncharacterized membrane protein (UPF0127 family)